MLTFKRFSWRKPARKPLFLFYGLAVVILAVTGVLWCVQRNNDPEYVFWAMMNRSLSTTGVTIQAEQGNGGSRNAQIVQYSFGGNSRAHMWTKLSQEGTKITDELIGTTAADYVRYVSINTDQKTSKGKTPDFSKVLGVWASSGQKGQLFSQAVMGTGLPLGGVAIPLANLNKEARQALLAQIHDQNVYHTDFSKARKSTVNGRPVFVYDVSVPPVRYATMMKSFARNVGIHDLDQLDPAMFEGQPEFKLRLTVDVRSKHLIKAQPVEGVESIQTYTSYDVPVTVEPPAQTITAVELQQRISGATQ